MTAELVLALSGSSIDAVAEALGFRCGQGYERHDSLYRGEYNLFHFPEPLVVKYNFVESEEEWDHPEFKQHNIVLVVESTDRPDYFRDLVNAAGISFTEVRCKVL